MASDPVELSTNQASRVLGVHESSVKRWCNAGVIPCSLTPGGHRRIAAEAVVEFARDQQLPTPLIEFGSDAGRAWAGVDLANRGGDFAGLAALTMSWMEDGRRRPLAALFRYAVSEGIEMSQVFENVVGEVMRRIGDRYHAGSLSIGDEHRMTQVMRDVLVTLSAQREATPDLDAPPQAVAVVGCSRDEVHEIGALMVRLVLEEAGWRVVYLGLSVPTEEFATQQARYGAALVCISMMPPTGMTEALALVRLLDRMYDPSRPYRLALGGAALAGLTGIDRAETTIPEVRVFARMPAFERWVRDLA